MLSRLQKLAVRIALVAYTLTALCPGDGFVLCIEADGHVGLESVVVGCTDCCAADGTAAGADGQAQPCPCVDVSVTGPDASTGKVRLADVERLALGGALCERPGIEQELALALDAAWAPPDENQRAGSSLHELRCGVVLLL